MRSLKILILVVCALLPVTATAQWADNFDSYFIGSVLSGQGGWTSWGGDPGAANFYVIECLVAEFAEFCRDRRTG